MEIVATPSFQRRGLVTRVMEGLVQHVPSSYELAALCPAEPELYLRLRWRFWRGPLHIRASEANLPTPDDSVMVLELPGRRRLDLAAPLSVEWREGELW